MFILNKQVVVSVWVQWYKHYSDVIMSMMASQITSISFVCSTVCSGADQRKYQSSMSLAFVRGIHQSPVDSPNKGPVMCKMFPFDDIIMVIYVQDILRSSYRKCCLEPDENSCPKKARDHDSHSSLWPSFTKSHTWIGSSLVQIMACHLLGTRQLPASMTTYYQMES